MHRSSSRSAPPRSHPRWRTILPALVLGFAAVLPAQPASADGEDETTVAYVLIQQALGHLAHGTSHVAMDQAMEKIDDALDTTDNTGVDLALVKQAQTALEAEDIDQARTLLEQSIQVAITELPPATGAQTGTKLVVLPLRGRGGLTGQDWTFGTVSLVLLLAGAALAFRFRPHDTVRQLRISLAGGPSRSGAEAGETGR